MNAKILNKLGELGMIGYFRAVTQRNETRPPQDAEVDLIVIAAKAIDLADAWYGGGERCLRFIAGRFGYDLVRKENQ